MRETLNNNPLAQAAVVGVLLIVAGFFLLSTMGGGEEEETVESGATEATVTVAGSGASGTATGATPGEAVESAIDAATEGGAAEGGVTPVPALPPNAAESAPPPPRPVVRAFNANRTVAILFVRNGGIDDRLVRDSARRLESQPDVSFFTVPASRIARYASIAQGVAVDRVPALVVIRPKKLAGRIPQASVYHGFQSAESIVQAVVDARYRGRTLDYHP